MPTQQQLFCLFHFAGVRASRAYRAAWGGVERKQRPRRKKNKKKYAIRDSNPENLLGRQKCYPYTNGVCAQHRWVRSDEDWLNLKM